MTSSIFTPYIVVTETAIEEYTVDAHISFDRTSTSRWVKKGKVKACLDNLDACYASEDIVFGTIVLKERRENA